MARLKTAVYTAPTDTVKGNPELAPEVKSSLAQRLFRNAEVSHAAYAVAMRVTNRELIIKPQDLSCTARDVASMRRKEQKRLQPGI